MELDDVIWTFFATLTLSLYFTMKKSKISNNAKTKNEKINNEDQVITCPNYKDENIKNKNRTDLDWSNIQDNICENGSGYIGTLSCGVVFMDFEKFSTRKLWKDDHFHIAIFNLGWYLKKNYLKGACIKILGDAVMAIFPTKEQTFNAVAAMHEEVKHNYKDLNKNGKPRIRIGASFGEVDFIFRRHYNGSEDGEYDVYGEIVNEAARLCSFVEPSQYAFSFDLADEFKEKFPSLEKKEIIVNKSFYAKGKDFMIGDKYLCFVDNET